MKTIFFNKSIVAIALAFCIFISCTKDSGNPESIEIGRETFARQLTNSIITDFLDDYYKATYTFGDTEEVYVGNDTYEVTEVFLSGTLPKGFVVTERGTEKFLYFVDFDRAKEEINAFSILENENVLLTNLLEDSNGNKITDIDIIEYIKDNPTSEGRFWGWQSNNDCHDVYQGTSPQGVNYCMTQCTRTHFVFWIATSTQPYTVGGLHEC